MPMDRRLYPDNWNEIAQKIKNEAGWTCTNCGRPCRKPGESEHELFDRLPSAWLNDWYETVDSEEFGDVEIEKPGRFILTVAHLNHRPEDCDLSNLKALCAPCHCRYDLQPSSMFIKKQLKLERCGQLSLEVG
ncbi:HNH endonuclease [Adonisia turfae]|uniref:HNH endonuclease n=1 Tax=Adonisia turfae CCMR0081 TaxID=2292702 RepID=A0A6M0RJR1_9CYAN|nr:HNH endonuclease [Adonisia turfae]NEZ56498.1 HNH endonuclease [Adonisia turfae CCMR0081]